MNYTVEYVVHPAERHPSSTTSEARGTVPVVTTTYRRVFFFFYNETSSVICSITWVVFAQSLKFSLSFPNIPLLPSSNKKPIVLDVTHLSTMDKYYDVLHSVLGSFFMGQLHICYWFELLL